MTSRPMRIPPEMERVIKQIIMEYRKEGIDLSFVQASKIAAKRINQANNFSFSNGGIKI